MAVLYILQTPLGHQFANLALLWAEKCSLRGLLCTIFLWTSSEYFFCHAKRHSTTTRENKPNDAMPAIAAIQPKINLSERVKRMYFISRHVTIRFSVQQIGM